MSSRPGSWRRIIRDFTRTVCFNEMLDGFTERWVSRLSRSLPRYPSLKYNSIGVVSYKLRYITMSLSAFCLRRQIDGETHRKDKQQWLPISDNEVTSLLKSMGNCKSPGPEKVCCFCVKRITYRHTDLTRNYNLMVQNPNSVTTGCLKKQRL